MTIGLILIPYNFVNNTEIADAVKVNSNFSVLAQVLNEVITDMQSAAGSQASLTDRLAISLNDDGTLKPIAFPVGTFDARAKRTVDADADILNTDGTLLVDTTAGDVTVTLPPSATAMCQPTVINIGLTGYAAIVVPDGADTIMGGDSYNLGVAGEFAQFIREGSNWWRVK